MRIPRCLPRTPDPWVNMLCDLDGVSFPFADLQK